jgi:predicted aconitase
MFLTKAEEAMLGGEHGEGVQKAMELLVAIGEAFDAPKMIPVTRAHAASSGQEGDLFFIEMLAKGGAHCKIPTTTNPVVDFEYFQNVIDIGEQHEEASVAWKVKRYYKEIGAVMSQSCIPYLAENIPQFGEHVAFSESSATPYVNSVIGAFSNRESIQTALAAGVIGETPEFGLHMRDNRKGTVLVKVKTELRNGFDYSILGQYVGKKIGNGIPVFDGIKKRPSIDQYINLCAMMNVTGAIPMFYIPGYTIGANTVEEAFAGKLPQQRIDVSDQEMKQTNDELQTTSGDIDLVMLGCPHYNLDQMGEVARLLNGKRLRPNVSFWINTSATTKIMAERAGYLKTLQDVGARVIVDTCIDMFCFNEMKGKTGMTDSPKCAYYRRFGNVKVGSVAECVAAAVE